MRTKPEIESEITKLKALVPIGKWEIKTRSGIDAMIEELEFGYDQTAEEWEELDSSTQDAVNSAQLWKHANSEHRPSESWKGLVK